jgi:hypothetical protein
MVSINYQNLIRIIRPAFEKITVLCFEANLKNAFFWNWNVHSVGHQPMKGKHLNAKYEQDLSSHSSLSG